MRFVALLTILAFLTLDHANGGDRFVGTNLKPSQPAAAKVNYTVIEQCNIMLAEDGGYGRVIVVEPAQRSEHGLIALAEQLRHDTSADSEVVVYIYDDSVAATMRKDAANESLTYADMKWHDDHMMGIYTKIPRDGRPPLRLTMTLEGADGPRKEFALP